ncbi:MAG TPA: hypothetical protein VEB23_02420, partial [Ramlibacter sp.]|nr:hypothetical protein [Ramlibacter sp.]
MAILDQGAADLPLLRDRFSAWVRKQPGCSDARVAGLRQASQANGFSNETYRLTLAIPGSGEEELILRLPPALTGLFPDY